MMHHLLPDILSTTFSAGIDLSEDSIAQSIKPLYDFAKPILSGVILLSMAEELLEFIIHANPDHLRNAFIVGGGGMIALKASEIMVALIPGFALKW